MKKITALIIGFAIAFGLTAGATQAQNKNADGQVEKPSVAELHAFWKRRFNSYPKSSF